METTGASPGVGSLTEIAIITYEGEQEGGRFVSLIKPEMPIPRKIEWITGISNAMVAEAPRFCEVARKIVEMTAEHVLVGHNIAYDYGYLKAAFADLGYRYRRECLCTLRLARQTLPALTSYKLSALNKELGLGGESFHRALADAEVTAALFFTLRQRATSLPSEAGTLAPHLKIDALADVPDTPGVYEFEGLGGQVIYVGKSKALRSRLRQHVVFSRQSIGFKQQFFSSISGLRFTATGSELIAELEELHLIKSLRPSFNRVGKRRDFKYGLFGCLERRELVIKYLRSDKTSQGLLLGRYGSKRSAEKARDHLLSTHPVKPQLPDPQLFSLWQSIVEAHTYPSSDALVRVAGRRSDEQGYIVIAAGVYRGYFFAQDPYHDHGREAFIRDEYEDLKRLLCRRLKDVPAEDWLPLAGGEGYGGGAASLGF